MTKDKTFTAEFRTLQYATVHLMKAACKYFNSMPNAEVYKASANWSQGYGYNKSSVSVSVSQDDWEAWHALTHINNIANCKELLENEKTYTEAQNNQMIESMDLSSKIIEGKADNDVTKLMKVNEVTKSFLLQFCTNEKLIKWLAGKPA